MFQSSRQREKRVGERRRVWKRVFGFQNVARADTTNSAFFSRAPFRRMWGANNGRAGVFRTYVRGGVRAPQHDPQSVEGIVREAYRDARYRLVRALAVDVLDAVAPRDQCQDRPETRRGRRGRGAPRALGGALVAARGKRVVIVVFRRGLPRRPERLPGVPRASHAPRLRHGARKRLSTSSVFGAEFFRRSGGWMAVPLVYNISELNPHTDCFALTKKARESGAIFSSCDKTSRRSPHSPARHGGRRDRARRSRAPRIEDGPATNPSGRLAEPPGCRV